MEKLLSQTRKNCRYPKHKIIEIVKTVSENYTNGEYTLESVCKNAGVPYRTWRDWWIRYYANRDNTEHNWYFLAEVADLWENAQYIADTIRKEELKETAETMLMKRMMGWEYKETTTRFKMKTDKTGNEVLVPIGYTVVNKLVLPHAGLIQFVLKTLAPHKYGEYSNVIKSNSSDIRNFRRRTIEEINAEILELEQGYVDKKL